MEIVLHEVCWCTRNSQINLVVNSTLEKSLAGHQQHLEQKQRRRTMKKKKKNKKERNGDPFASWKTAGNFRLKSFWNFVMPSDKLLLVLSLACSPVAVHSNQRTIMLAWRAGLQGGESVQGLAGSIAPCQKLFFQSWDKKTTAGESAGSSHFYLGVIFNLEFYIIRDIHKPCQQDQVSA